jgi:hypothetical protein
LNKQGYLAFRNEKIITKPGIDITPGRRRKRSLLPEVTTETGD